MSTATIEVEVPEAFRNRKYEVFFVPEEAPVERYSYRRSVREHRVAGAGWMAVLAYAARDAIRAGWESLKSAVRWIVGNVEAAAYWTMGQLRKAGRWLLKAAARAKAAVFAAAASVWHGTTAAANWLWAKAVASSVFVKAKAVAAATWGWTQAGELAAWLAVPTKFVIGGATALGAMLWIGGQALLLVSVAAATVLVIADRVIPVPDGRFTILRRKVEKAVATDSAVPLNGKEAGAVLAALEVEDRVRVATERLAEFTDTDSVVEISEYTGRQYVAHARQSGDSRQVRYLLRDFRAQQEATFGEAAEEMFDWEAVKAGMTLENRAINRIFAKTDGKPEKVAAAVVEKAVDQMVSKDRGEQPVDE